MFTSWLEPMSQGFLILRGLIPNYLNPKLGSSRLTNPPILIGEEIVLREKILWIFFEFRNSERYFSMVLRILPKFSPHFFFNKFSKFSSRLWRKLKVFGKPRKKFTEILYVVLRNFAKYFSQNFSSQNSLSSKKITPR